MTDKELHDRIVGIFLDTKYPVRNPTAGCACMGLSDGEPVCYCEMKSVVKLDERFFKVTNVLDRENLVIRFEVNEIFFESPRIRFILDVPESEPLLTFKKIFVVLRHKYSHEALKHFKEKILAGKWYLSDGEAMYLRTNEKEIFANYVRLK